MEASSLDVVKAEPLTRRRRPGAAIKEVKLTAAPATLDLAGLAAATWA